MAMMTIWICMVCLVSMTLCSGTFMPLHRAHPPSHKGNLAMSVSSDLVRQRVIANFSLSGSDNVIIAGLYYTKLYLGTPPREYALLIDTGSEFTWVSCQSCTGCPNTTDLGTTLNLYDPMNSSTASLAPCSDRHCTSCDGEKCTFSITYGDGSVATGYEVYDQLRISSIMPHGRSSHPVTFGCSTMRTGELSYNSHGVDGIFALGQGGSSLVSQLFSQGVTPHVFSHCLKGGDVGGGFLVFGEVVDPRVVYTPLLPSGHYSVSLSAIDINGQLLPIDPNMMSSDGSPGIIFDSGTTYTYLYESDYSALVAAINKAVSKFGYPVVSATVAGDLLCYVQNTSQPIQFPPVTLIFDGGAHMKLRPADYIAYIPLRVGPTLPCLGFMAVQDQGIPILGEITLKDKIVVYDIYAQRMGWTDYHDCWSSYKVNATYGSAPSQRYRQPQIWLWSNLLVLVTSLLLLLLI